MRVLGRRSTTAASRSRTSICSVAEWIIGAIGGGCRRSMHWPRQRLGASKNACVHDRVAPGCDVLHSRFPRLDRAYGMDIGRDAHRVKSLSRHTLEQMVARSSEGILLADAQDPNLPIVYANPAYEALTGYTVEELAGNSWPLVKRDVEGQPELERLKAAIGRSESCQVMLPDLRKDGTSWLSHVAVEPLYNARGELKYFLCIQKPVTNGAAEHAVTEVEVTLLQRELGRARQKIASLDRIDPSTGLMRFGYFQEIMRRDLAIARRDQRMITLLLFEIVEFEAYRQTFGSKAADSCQRMIGAQIMRTLRRAGDLCARYDDSTL